MFYDFSVTVTANTPENAPKEQEMKLTAGVIQEVNLLFPPGPEGMVKVRIMEGGHQFVPTNPEGYFATDGEIIKIPGQYYELREPYILKAVAYSPNTAYGHTISIRIDVLRPEEVEKQSSWVVALKKFLKMVGLG